MEWLPREGISVDSVESFAGGDMSNSVFVTPLPTQGFVAIDARRVFL